MIVKLKSHDVPIGRDVSLEDYMDTVEKDSIALAMNCTDGVVTEAASLLGLKRTTLTMKLKLYNMGKEPDAESITRAQIERARLRTRLKFLDYLLENPKQKP